ncbi:MAG: type II secretion system F family protein [Candidatus Nanopelagicales bacterium]|nr:type II secretion system F family protein [Candidatus Nanopelagicales bacterium]
MSRSTIGALLGMLVAVGLLVSLTRVRHLRRPDLLTRITPYIPASAQGQLRRRHEPTTTQVLAALGASLLAERGDRPTLDARLASAGRTTSPSAYRLEQAMAAGAGASVGVLVAVGCVTQGAPALIALVLPGVGALGGVLVIDRLLGQQTRARRRRITRQLPFVADLLAFAVAAGEPPVAALARVADTCVGPLADEVRACLSEIRGGMPIATALRALASRTGSSEVDRFVEGLVVSLERGTPVADVLRAQASDARADQRRVLLELAGRKEVGMLVPVVFLILPTVVLIAIFPGVHGLELIVR